MDAHIHPPRDDLPYSPTADSAIDIPNISPLQPKTEPVPARRDISTRLADLAARISDHNQSDKPQDPTILQCLDTIERTLSPASASVPASTTTDDDDDDNEDPRANFALEIAKYRPQSTPTTTVTTSRSFHRSGAPSPSTIKTLASAEIQTQDQTQDQTQAPAQTQTQAQIQVQRQTQMQMQMQTLLNQLTTTTAALTTRRAESAYIYDLFTHRCQSLGDTVRVLQDEVRELCVSLSHWIYYTSLRIPCTTGQSEITNA